VKKDIISKVVRSNEAELPFMDQFDDLADSHGIKSAFLQWLSIALSLSSIDCNATVFELSA
jgi:hypothetical protein